MWADVLGNACQQGVVGYDALDTAGRQPMIITALVDVFVAAVAHEEWLSGIWFEYNESSFGVFHKGVRILLSLDYCNRYVNT